MMKKKLKRTTDSSLLKQLEWKAQKKKEVLCVQEYNKRSARVITCLRELEKIRKRTVKQFVPESRDCRHETATSNYITGEEAYIANFVRHFQPTHLTEEVI